MTGIHCLVVDDEPLAIDVVVTYLQNLNIPMIATANNAVEAFQQLQHDPVDLLFLDIQMPQLTGFDLLKSLPHRPLVVITTAYRDYAVEGFEWEVLDSLVKPFSFPRFLQTMEKVARSLAPPRPHAQQPPPEAQPLPSDDAIFLKTDRDFPRVPLDPLLYIESLKDYIRVFTTNGEYLCHQSLTDITTRLPAA